MRHTAPGFSPAGERAERMRVLMAWELGAGLGHVTPLLALARALRARGHEVTFALRAQEHAARIAAEGFLFMQAPAAPPGNAQPVRYRCFAELLLGEAFASEAGALAAARAWRYIFSALRPQLLLADHAPAALLAAHGFGLPAVTFGTPFTAPPAAARLPSFIPDIQVAERFDALLLDRLNAVQKALATPPLQAAGELYRGASPLVCSYPGLDCFGPRPAGHYVGAMEADAGPSAPAWPQGAGPRFLVYLRPAPLLGALFDVLARRRVRVIAHIPGWSATGLTAPANVHVSPVPLRMSALLGDCDAVASYGGNGVVVQALAAGKPLLLLPTHVEQLLNATAVEALGAGKVFLPGAGAADLEPHIEAFAPEGALRAAAEAFAQRPEVRGLGMGAVDIARKLETLAAA